MLLSSLGLLLLIRTRTRGRDQNPHGSLDPPDLEQLATPSKSVAAIVGLGDRLKS